MVRAQQLVDLVLYDVQADKGEDAGDHPILLE